METKVEQKQMHLNLFVMNTGHHEASWRHPRTEPRRVTELGYYKELARWSERGKLDSLFLADGYGLPPTIRYKVLPGLEPFTLLSALVGVTERIGLIGTASTTYNDPFHIARKFASLDHISEGRAGWNIVTSISEAGAFNFGNKPLPAHSDRYRQADEFVEAVTGLWDTWEDDAIVVDRESGVYADTDKIHPLDHHGEWFDVRGPLNVPRSPQGYPLLVQAGSSEEGKEFAARTAEAVFTAQNTLEDGRTFYRDLKSRMAKYGRSPEELKVLPGFLPIIGATEDEAREKEARLNELTIPEFGLRRLSGLFKIDFSRYALDDPFPLNDLPGFTAIEGNRSRFQLVEGIARREGLTIRQLIMRTAASRGHASCVGTPKQIADMMEAWFTGGAADGFNLMPAYLPDGLREFVEQVVPLLQQRGLFRKEYTGTTLRDHYGLPRRERGMKPGYALT